MADGNQLAQAGTVTAMKKPLNVIPAEARATMAETLTPYLKDNVRPMDVVAAIENDLCKAGVKKTTETVWSFLQDFFKG